MEKVTERAIALAGEIQRRKKLLNQLESDYLNAVIRIPETDLTEFIEITNRINSRS